LKEHTAYTIEKKKRSFSTTEFFNKKIKRENIQDEKKKGHKNKTRE